MRLKFWSPERRPTYQPVRDSGSSRIVFLPGTLVVDWLDEQALEDVAEQLDLRSAVESRLMEVEGTTQKVGISQVISAEVAVADELTHERKFGREAASVRLRAVLNNLVARDELADFLLGSYRNRYQDDPYGDSLRDRDLSIEAVSALVVHRDSDPEKQMLAKQELRMALGQRCYSAARLRDWFLLEGHWAVERNSECALSLVGISPAGSLVETSELFSVLASVPSGDASEGWRLPGARLQDGKTRKATIFGAVDNYHDNNRLSVSPIAIFDRKAGDPGFAWGSDSPGPGAVPSSP